MNKLILILLFLLCFSAFGVVTSSAADGDTEQAPVSYGNYTDAPIERDITEEQWKGLTADEHFGYKDELEQKAKKPEKQEKPKKNLLVSILEVIFSDAGRIVLWIILFLVLGYAIFKFVVGEKSFLFARNKKQVLVSASIVNTTEEDLLDVNWEKKLEEVLKQGDLRHAIRYSYMWMLQMLQEKSLINYRIDKTNYEYAGELKDAYKQPFRQITRQYEYAWYGQYPVSEESYNKFRNDFIMIKMQINSN